MLINTHVPTERVITMSPLIAQRKFASYSVFTTIAWNTTWRMMKFVDEIGSTVLDGNLCWVFVKRGLRWTILKLTVLRTSSSFSVGWAPSNQPEQSVPHLYATARVVGNFLPPTKTVPSLKELAVTQLWIVMCYATYPSIMIGFTQGFIMIARIGYKVKWQLQKD